MAAFINNRKTAFINMLDSFCICDILYKTLRFALKLTYKKL
jgi:hypothetical protein